MNVKDFILQHPGESFHMLTPQGIIWLPADRVYDLLTGKSTMAHPRMSATGVYVAAEELLTQEVQSDDFGHNRWYIRTEYPQEKVQKQDAPDQSDVLGKLNEKLDRNYEDFVNGWLKMEPSLLVEYAREIAATKQVYDELKGNDYSRDHLEYLMRFENPLEVVRDKWIEEFFEPDVSEEMTHALWDLMDKRDADQNYELDREYMPEQNGGMTLC
jgi:hypothetical protein